MADPSFSRNWHVLHLQSGAHIDYVRGRVPRYCNCFGRSYCQSSASHLSLWTDFYRRRVPMGTNSGVLVLRTRHCRDCSCCRAAERLCGMASLRAARRPSRWHALLCLHSVCCCSAALSWHYRPRSSASRFDRSSPVSTACDNTTQGSSTSDKWSLWVVRRTQACTAVGQQPSHLARHAVTHQSCTHIVQHCVPSDCMPVLRIVCMRGAVRGTRQRHLRRRCDRHRACRRQPKTDLQPVLIRHLPHGCWIRQLQSTVHEQEAHC